MKRVLISMLTVASLGTSLGVAAATPASAAPANHCSLGVLCIASGFNYTGTGINVWKCGEIRNIGAEWGSDQVRSFQNNQTGHVVATFYNWTGSEWDPIGWSRAAENVPYAPEEFYSVPGGVDGVKPC
jgi:hypothetical protein